MKKERLIETYYEVDGNGFIKNKFRLDSGTENIPSYLIKKWDGNIFKPRYDKGSSQWVETARDYEKLGFSSLENFKSYKDKEFNRLCEEFILNGFSHTVDEISYHFSYDREAQTNFQETFQLFQNNALDIVMWTAHTNAGKVRIPLTKESFDELYYASVKHKLNTISYYRDILLPELSRAKNADEVNAIKWEYNLPSEKEIVVKTDDTVEKRIESAKIAQAEGDTELINIIMMGMMM